MTNRKPRLPKRAMRSLFALAAALACVLVYVGWQVGQTQHGAGESVGRSVLNPISVSPAPAPPRLARPGTIGPPWQRFAAAIPAGTEDKPRIAVVIDDLGLDRRRTARTIALPAPLTLAFLPYAEDLARQSAAARRAGHELLVHLPMEPLGPADPGPGALYRDHGADTLAARVQRNLGAFTGYVGVNNHMGSAFTADAASMAAVMRSLRENGLLFLDSLTTADSQGAVVAAEAGVPFVVRDVFLDHDPSRPAIEAALARTERVARQQGRAVLIGHPKDNSLDALEAWLPALEQKGFALVPISALVSPPS